MARKKQLILNRYRPISEAGIGGFASVQVAWDTRIQRHVAIKCIELNESEAARIILPGASAPPLQDVPLRDEDDDPESAVFAHSSTMPESPDQAKSIDLLEEEPLVRSLTHIPGLDEARTAAALSDSSIVSVYDFEVQGSTAYLIMEYVEGMSLRELLRDHADSLTIDIITAVFAAVARALEVAHANQVLHLDIKPDNILINRRGQVKVTDFGLATLTDVAGFGSTGGGTIGYMPLEQMRQESLDERCDEWALAALTYEMLVGKNPFLAANLNRAEAAILDAELVLPSLCWHELDFGIDDPLFYALDPDKEERYASVADFAEELEPFLGSPKRGTRELAALVNGVESEEGREEPQKEYPACPSIPLRERITERQVAVGSRVVSFLGAALVVYLALSNMAFTSGFTNPFFWGLFAPIVLLSAWKPGWGSLLAYSTLSISFLFNGGIPAGCLLIVMVGVWWYFMGRESVAQANTSFVVPLAGSIGLAQLTPLVAGLSLSPLRAVGSTIFSIFVAFLLAACGSQSLIGWDIFAYGVIGSGGTLTDTLLATVKDPAMWCIAGSWLISAGVLSVFRLRETRWRTTAGLCVAGFILLVGICVAARLTSVSGVWIPTTYNLLFTLASVGIALAVGWLLPEYEYIDMPFDEEFVEN